MATNNDIRHFCVTLQTPYHLNDNGARDHDLTIEAALHDYPSKDMFDKLGV